MIDVFLETWYVYIDIQSSLFHTHYLKEQNIELFRITLRNSTGFKYSHFVENLQKGHNNSFIIVMKQC